MEKYEVKAVVAQFYRDQLFTERPYVSAMVREVLVPRAKDFNILLDDVTITHLFYGPEFSRTVEQKQVAQQEEEQLRFVVAKVEQRAKGESRVAALILDATSTTGLGLIQLRHIKAAKEISVTLSRASENGEGSE